MNENISGEQFPLQMSSCAKPEESPCPMLRCSTGMALKVELVILEFSLQCQCFWDIEKLKKLLVPMVVCGVYTGPTSKHKAFPRVGCS